MFDAITALAASFGAAVLYVTRSPVAAVYAGILAKHMLEMGAKNYPFWSVRLSIRFGFGPFMIYVALGVTEAAHVDGAVANLVSTIIGFAGPEIVLSVAMGWLKKKGLVPDDMPVPPNTEETKP